MEFVEKSFQEIKDYLGRYLNEVSQLDNIKSRVIRDTKDSFECWLVNRNKIDTEASLEITTTSVENNRTILFNQGRDGHIHYKISSNGGGGSEKTFNIQFDEYHLFWTKTDYYNRPRTQEEFAAKDISDSIWDEFLKAVGILI